jgi:hypothetical protein
MNLPGTALQLSACIALYCSCLHADAFMNLSNNALTLWLLGAVFWPCAAAVGCLAHLGSAWHHIEAVERCLILHND